MKKSTASNTRAILYMIKFIFFYEIFLVAILNKIYRQREQTLRGKVTEYDIVIVVFVQFGFRRKPRKSEDYIR